MPRNKCFWFRIVVLYSFCVLSALLFLCSTHVDYQRLLAEEHIRFRRGFPSQLNWIQSPDGVLNTYLFNVTNAAAFLDGTDTQMKLQEIGPIVYRIKGRNEVISQTETHLVYRKIRYDRVEFDPLASCAPDILNQTIILPNFMLLGTAAKLHSWLSFAHHVFNVISVYEDVFLTRSVYFFLWEFEIPALKALSMYVPNLVSNCGMLHNALKPKMEIYNVSIGTNNGLDNFFRVNSLNNNTYFPEQADKWKSNSNKNNLSCPIEIANAFDNSLFPNYIKPNDIMDVVSIESCRTHRMKYTGTVQHLGLQAYRYSIAETSAKPTCLDSAMDIKLPKGMFDSTKCLFNDVPSAFSSPHFHGSSYNWSEHFEGLNPNTHDHEPNILLEPQTGIPIEERYRFQTNLPMPNMKDYSKDLQRFSNMIIPSFWYEFDLDDLPQIVIFLIKFNITYVPVLQPILMGLFALLSVYCALRAYLLITEQSYKDLLDKFVNTPSRTLETNFQNNIRQDGVQLNAVDCKK